jgi:uncharacterized membrane protein
MHATPLPTAGEAWAELALVPVGGVAGLFGSTVDSLLGATVQFSGWDSLKRKVHSSPPFIRVLC